MASPGPIAPPATVKTPDEHVRWALAATDRKSQAERLGAVARVYHTSRDVLNVFNRIAAAKDGHRLALLFVDRMPNPMPTGLILLSAPLLQSRDVGIQLRVHVAGRLIESMPDRIESIGPIVRALTAGLGKVRTLERLVQLQSRVLKSEIIDGLVTDLESTTKLSCPKCTTRLTRPALIKHLWKKHRLIYEHGNAREPGALVERVVEEFTSSREPEAIDRVYAVTEQLYAEAEPRQVHQAILSRLGQQHDDAEQLLKDAAEAGGGLCPSCYSTVAPSLPPLPDALAFANGRLFGEGCGVEALRGKLVVAYPDGSIERVADPNDRSGPREFAVKVGTGIAAVGAIFAIAMPLSVMKPLLPTLGLCLLSVGAYTGLLYRERKVPKPDTRAIDAAWNEIAPGVGRSARAIRFLTRLCRTSLGIGTVDERSKVVWELVEHAAVLAEKGPAQTQLLAAVRLLQAHDSSRIGKEWVNQLLTMWEPFFRGEVSPVYAEAVAQMLLESDLLSDRDAARLRVQLPATAFDTGLTPAGLNALAERCPNFSRLLAGNSDWFDLLHELWKMRTTRPWETSIGPAQSAIELTKKGGSNLRTFLSYPDTVLIADVDKELGDVLIGRRGITLGEFTVADADADIALETTKKGAFILNFGPHRIALERKLPDKAVRLLKGWLKFRADRLLPAVGRSANVAVPERVQQVLAPLAVECPMCRTTSFVQIGQVGLAQSLPA